MIVRYKDYEIRPYSNNLCWELYEHRKIERGKRKGEKDWVSMGVYPSDFGHALSIIYELELKKGNDVVDIKRAVATAKRLYNELMAVE